MKNLNVPVLFFVLCINNIFSQTPPTVEWQQITWSPTGMDNLPQGQAQSADDWWYSHKNLYCM